MQVVTRVVSGIVSGVVAGLFVAGAGVGCWPSPSGASAPPAAWSALPVQSLCVNDVDGRDTLRPGAVRVVLAPACTSGQLKARQPVCGVVVDGDVVEVSGVIEVDSAIVAVTADCDGGAVTCVTPPLAAGSYTLRHGALSLPFTLSSSRGRVCTP